MLQHNYCNIWFKKAFRIIVESVKRFEPNVTAYAKIGNQLIPHYVGSGLQTTETAMDYC